MYKAGKKIGVIIRFILGRCSFVSNASNFFIHSLNRLVLKKCLRVAGFLQSGALFANIRYDPRSEYNRGKSDHSERQRRWGVGGETSAGV